MDVTCPKCRAEFRLDVSKLINTETLRCEKCDHVWKIPTHSHNELSHSEPVAAQAQAVSAQGAGRENSAISPEQALKDLPPTPSEQTTSITLDEVAVSSRSGTDKPQGLTLYEQSEYLKEAYKRPKKNPYDTGLILSIALAFVVMLSFVFMRVPIVRVFPDLASLYKMIGLPVNLLGLEIYDIQAHITIGQEGYVLTVSGKVVNTTNTTVEVPELWFHLLDAANESLLFWAHEMDSRRLPSGAQMEFTVTAPELPSEATSVEALFATPTTSH